MMIVALKEAGEPRVALTPAAVGQLRKAGFSLAIECGAGLAAGYSDEAYQAAGAEVYSQDGKLLEQAEILLSLNPPDPRVLASLRPKSLLISQVDKDPKSEIIQTCQSQQISLISMLQIPRISRAQSMDTLSSQANLAGYKAVLEGIAHYKRLVPMMMTAAGMVHPAKVLILGAGVAGLQAIATAKRLGAVVYAFDVRRAAKEQVESLGAEFVEVSEEDAETKGGYAAETSADYQAKQAALIEEYAAKSDLVISTALIPGRPAPVLLPKATVDKMKPGSVIVDMATARGGNCELSKKDEVIDYQGVTLVGWSNLAGLVPATASELYANNLVNLLHLLSKEPGKIELNAEDEIIQQALLCHEGRYLPFAPAKEV